MKFIAVNSLSHSGSTIFSLFLSNQGQFVSLGEIFQVVRESPNTFLDDDTHLCSCGKPASKCQFWGPLLHKFNTLPNSEQRYEHLSEKYKLVLDAFEEKYGSDKVLIDTSKGSKYLSFLRANPQLKPQVFFLLKDVRSYTHSQVLNARKQNRKGLRKLKAWPFFLFLKWYVGNKKRSKYFAQTDIPQIQIGYEEFCLNTDKTKKVIDRFLGIDTTMEHSDDMPINHILYGNELRLNTDKELKIKYDSRWLKNTGLLLPTVILWFVMRFNKKHVYSNS